MFIRSCTLIVFGVLSTITTCNADGVVAYVGATVETVTDKGTLHDATVLVRDGRIEAVGTDVELPLDAQVVDVSGHTIMPAVVDPYCPVTIPGGAAASSGSRTVVFNGRTFTIPGTAATTAAPFQRIRENLDPLTLKNELTTNARYGVGMLHLVTRGYGQSAFAQVLPKTPESAVSATDGRLFLAVTNSTVSLDVLRNGLKGRSRSRSTGTASRSSTRSQSASSASSSSRTTSSSSSSSSSTDSLWEEVRSGKKPLFVNVNNAATIMYVLKMQEDYEDLRLVLIASAPAVYQTMSALRGRNVAIILGAGLSIAPRSNDRINVPRLLAEADIDFAFSTSLTSSLSSMPDTPLFPVSLLVKSGLPRDAALRALTHTPAKLSGLGETHGTLAKGRVANLLIVDGDPLSASSQIRQVIVEGTSVYED
jgi:hypothetical protein